MATGARPSPPELLREMLAEDRAAGFTFDDVFTEDVACAARANSGWQDALLDTRDAWRANWDRTPAPPGITADLLDDACDHMPWSPVPS